jgi:hypothetical protein
MDKSRGPARVLWLRVFVYPRCEFGTVGLMAIVYAECRLVGRVEKARTIEAVYK